VRGLVPLPHDNEPVPDDGARRATGPCVAPPVCRARPSAPAHVVAHHGNEPAHVVAHHGNEPAHVVAHHGNEPALDDRARRAGGGACRPW
jgi:hypothetical protein